VGKINKDSFCNAIWEETFQKINGSYDKSDYASFTIPKKGGHRTITYLKKDSSLYNLQKKLLHNYLNKLTFPTCVHGFRLKESYQSYLAPHIASKYFLRLDIKDFFSSLSTEYISKELKRYISLSTDNDTEEIINLVVDLVTLEGTLPQGASTSPAVSNIVMARFDQRILKYCQALDITYTRYADDLLFSSNKFDFSQKKWFIKKIKHILADAKLRINYSKIKVSKYELSLNGYVIASNEIRLSRKRLSDIRHILSRMNQNYEILQTQGESVFLSRINSLTLLHRNLTAYPFETLFLLIQYLCGYRAFLISWIDPYRTESSFQKELKRLILRIENTINQFS
jgi:hypothetical protein